MTCVYEGPIRAGQPGNLTSESYHVIRCDQCDAAFPYPKPKVSYATEEYRESYNGSAQVEAFLARHDADHIQHLHYLKDLTVRGNIIADVGCAAGSFLDLVKGVARQTIAVEPFVGYHESLKSRGHTCYASLAELLDSEGSESVDLVTCFQVIEHVDDPRTFLEDIRDVLRPGGLLLMATPNHDDFLMQFGPSEYKPFFYRTAHPWCFTQDSLNYLANAIGYDVQRAFAAQRYDLSNALMWMRDGTPSGNGRLTLDARANHAWRESLQESGYGDALYALWSKPIATTSKSVKDAA
jgi:2-polyprenyl-3-methyl-5-hydroxy-6-metoxy-1,4-benzoquinol methylase